MEDYMPSLQDFYTSPELNQAQQDMDTAGTTAVNYQSAASLLPSKLREAVFGKVNYNKDIIEARNKAQGDYFAAPSAARAKYSDPTSENYIFNPFQAEQLVSSERSMAYQPFANLTDILGQRMGTLADIINAGVGAFNSDVSAKQGAYNMSQDRYNNLFSKAGALADAAYKEESLKRSGSGSGGTSKSEQSDLDTAETWNEIMEATGGNEQGIWNMINRDQDALRASGVNVDKLWEWHRNYAGRTGGQPQTKSWFQKLFEPSDSTKANGLKSMDTSSWTNPSDFGQGLLNKTQSASQSVNSGSNYDLNNSLYNNLFNKQLNK